jgi:hypothetical protein
MTISGKKSAIVPAVFAVFTAMLVYYPLSIGPANWLYCNGLLPQETIGVVYRPLIWCLGCSPEPVQQAGSRWLSFWTPEREKQRRQEQLREALAEGLQEALAEVLQPGGPADEEDGSTMAPGDSNPREFRLPTADGTLVVTVSDPNADVQVRREEGRIEVTRKGRDQPMIISYIPGRRHLRMRQGKFDSDCESFSLEPGTNRAIAARFVPIDDEPDAQAVRRE